MRLTLREFELYTGGHPRVSNFESFRSKHGSDRYAQQRTWQNVRVTFCHQLFSKRRVYCGPAIAQSRDTADSKSYETLGRGYRLTANL